MHNVVKAATGSAQPRSINENDPRPATGQGVSLIKECPPLTMASKGSASSVGSASMKCAIGTCKRDD